MRQRKIILPLRNVGAVAIMVLGVHSAAAVDTFTIDQHVFAAGAAQQRTSACFTLSATIGQAGTGGVYTSADFSLLAGFWRAAPPAQDSVFSSSFEDCNS